MINIFLFLSFVFLLAFVLGRLIERIRIPWIFSTLIVGLLLAVYNPFASITSSEEFNFLAQMGMYFLLFIIGFEVDLKKLKRQSKFILKATVFIILLEAFFGAILIHEIFNYNWIISFVVALSFATVGEAILIPILDEFGMINTKLGQSIIGIGSLDDVIEILILAFVIFLVGSTASISYFNMALSLMSLFVMFGLAFVLTKIKKKRRKFTFTSIETLFLFVLFLLFLFLGVGEYAHATAIAALISGIATRTFIPRKRLDVIESEIRTMCYGFFAPLFFFWVGISIDMTYLITYPILTVLLVGVSNATKIIGAWAIGKNKLGVKKSILLGVGLSARFSTSIIIVKLLFDSGLIGKGLYSVIIASGIVFNFIIPFLFSKLIVRWNIVKGVK